MQLICPINGMELEKKSCQIKHSDFRIENIYQEVNCDSFYAELDGVAYMLKKFTSLSELSKFSLNNISDIVDASAVAWYFNYKENFAKFKYDKFVEAHNQFESETEIYVLDFISSDGNLIETFKSEASNSFNTKYCALDLDYTSLKSLKAKSPDVLCVCADATKKCFSNGKFDMIFSNSLHHVPYHFDATADQIIKYLRKGGYFYGIESQGLLAKIVIHTLSIFPRLLVPYFLSEIYNEKTLIKEWLKNSIKYKSRNFPEYKKLETTTFHEFYCFFKN